MPTTIWSFKYIINFKAENFINKPSSIEYVSEEPVYNGMVPRFTFNKWILRKDKKVLYLYFYVDTELIGLDQLRIFINSTSKTNENIFSTRQQKSYTREEILVPKSFYGDPGPNSEKKPTLDEIGTFTHFMLLSLDDLNALNTDYNSTTYQKITISIDQLLVEL